MKKKVKLSPADEQSLIKQLINGDAKAFDYVVSQYHGLMLTVARAIVGEAFADEIVQDAWLSAIKALPNFEGRSSLKTWLLQITSNGAKTRFKREQRQVSLDDGWESVSHDKFDERGHRLDDVLPWDEDTPDALLENEQLRIIIETSFRQLPANQRAMLTMYDMEGLDMSEICNILDISSSNARVLLHRARTTLHHKIEEYRGL
ncbi:MAG: RNA polymerase sigma factor [Pseudomonadota bacterium]|jgi:RNA polymerase sigma-70 factor (ECF subfamily)|uniref:DNA-directed RNA polymerase specialized sigma subunit n=2 Tax=Methylophaga TaxID=40222 RepID=F5T050_9GAMM|nr:MULTISPECIES: RNA polymerase sigma factor [Methylophaga]EGL55007.1 DNA-directed RNA polymerase specialized sigma subunit [Methylophaga aminisulfidivorans MP]MEC9412542.1 RNA polymerase sigma factor [Pseudomonadota bacterium]WVI84311.1 RNA polymerase sigma factor [Methylophaga thalassica]GLP99406.1 DNA-directed RNA polymerase sigma-70 factor [Methylophaga thalassica]